MGIAALAAAGLGGGLIRYGMVPTYLDHAEPDVAILAWRIVSGADLYPSPDSADFILTAYGPFLYLANALPLALFGGSIVASKLASLAAVAAAVAVFAWDARARYGTTLAALGTTAFIAVLLIAGPNALWVRAEPILVLLVTVAMAAMPKGDRPPGLVAAAVVGVCGGLAVSAKIHGFIYFAPIVLAAFASRWRTAWPVMGGAALLASLLPFAVPGISLVNFIHGLSGVVKTRGIEWGSMVSPLKWGAIFVAPGLVLLAATAFGRRVPAALWMFFGVLVLAMAANLYPASVPGAGWYHMLPFLPLSIAVLLRGLSLFDEASWFQSSLAAAFVVAFVTIAITPQKRLWRTFAAAEQYGQGAKDAAEALARFPGRSLGVGVGTNVAANYRATFVRPIPVFAGSPYLISPVMAMEQQFSGKPFGDSKIAALRECRVAVWLIPAGEAPFRIYNYFTGQPTFPPAVTAAFDAAYRRTERIGQFDVWECRHPN